MSEPTLTVEEISELVTFARLHPELAMLFSLTSTPRQALELAREKLEKEKQNG